MPTDKTRKRHTTERDTRGKQPAPQRLPASGNRAPERDRSQRQGERRIERFRER